MYVRCDRDWGEKKCNLAINIFLSRQTWETWHLSLCLQGERHCAGTSCSLITAFIKTKTEICDKDPGAIFSHPPVQSCFPCSPPPLPVPAEAAGMTDDITQQGFSGRYHHGEGISMETLGPLSRHRFMLLPHPSLLKGPFRREGPRHGPSPRDKLCPSALSSVFLPWCFSPPPSLLVYVSFKTQPFHYPAPPIWKQLPKNLCVNKKQNPQTELFVLFCHTSAEETENLFFIFVQFWWSVMIMLRTEISVNKHVCPPICLFTCLREKISPHLYPNYANNNMNGSVCLLLVWKASCFLLFLFPLWSWRVSYVILDCILPTGVLAALNWPQAWMAVCAIC